MGNKINSLMKRLFDYPIKRQPICFYRQEDFSSTGDALVLDENFSKGPPTEYDKLVQEFYDHLLEKRCSHDQAAEKNKRWSIQKVISKYPGWNELTISNLHSLFLLFDDNQNGMLNIDNFAAILESLGDETEMDLRTTKFTEADTDSDGWINYDEFLKLIYNFDPKENEEISGLAKLCWDVAENIRFVSSLSVGEQLEYGLF